MRLIISIPVFAYLLIAASIVMHIGPVEQSMLNVIIYEMTLPSARPVVFTVSDIFLIACFFILYIEVFKATRASTAAQIDHALSLVVFVIALVMFLMLPRLGNVTFFIITLATLIFLQPDAI